MSILSDFLQQNHSTNLYLILDEGTCQQEGISAEQLLESAFETGVRLFQYRNKVSQGIDFEKRVLQFYQEAKQFPEACVVLNDDLDLALRLSVPVHLGQGDLPFSFSLLPKHPIASIGYGASSHNPSEIERLQHLQEKSIGPDYTAFGALFASSTKREVPEVFSEIEFFLRENPSPFFVFIGGINLETVPKVYPLLARKNLLRRSWFAVIQSIFTYGKEKEGIKRFVEEWKDLKSKPWA